MTAEGIPDMFERVDAAIASGDGAALRAIMSEIDSGEARRLFGRLSGDDAAALLAALPPEQAAEVVLWLPPEQAAEILAQSDAAAGAAIAAELPSDERADVLGEMPEEAQEALTAQLPEEQREESERLLEYPPESAGGLMETELLSYASGTPVRAVISDMRQHQEKYAALGVQYIYVVDSSRRLLGAAPMRDLLLAPETAPIDGLLRGRIVRVRDTATTEEVASVFDEHHFMGLPVVDAEDRLLGVINRADVEEAEHDQADEQFRRSQGIVGGEELRTMPVGRRFRRRAMWLGVNMLLCLGGAFVIANNEEALKKAIVVAAMLPIVSATSGNAAMQAAAVSIRELTLGIIGPGSWRRVIVNEVMLALLMAAPLGVALALLAVLWEGTPTVALAVGIAMAANTLLALGIGAVVPLALRRVGVDPALASGPLTTTLADISGFLLMFACVNWLG